MSSDVPEYVEVANSLNDLEQEVKRFETLQKKYQKLHKVISDANNGKDECELTPKQFNDLKKLYTDLSECCERIGENSENAKTALEPLQNWQKLPEAMESDRKKVKMSTAGFKEASLPVWIGSESGHVKPPPLCGKIPLAAELRIVPGDLVAANTQANKPKENPSWILCRVDNFLGVKKNQYTVSDVAPEEGTVAETFDLSRKALIPLPKMIPQTWDENTEFAKGDFVLALFPGTTSFYEATVIETPSTTSGHYAVQFEDDEDEQGQTPVRDISPGFVVLSQRKK